MNRKLTKFEIWLKNKCHVNDKWMPFICIAFLLFAFLLSYVIADYGLSKETARENAIKETNCVSR
jgi:hypothetical protein